MTVADNKAVEVKAFSQTDNKRRRVHNKRLGFQSYIHNTFVMQAVCRGAGNGYYSRFMRDNHSAVTNYRNTFIRGCICNLCRVGGQTDKIRLVNAHINELFVK